MEKSDSTQVVKRCNDKVTYREVRSLQFKIEDCLTRGADRIIPGDNGESVVKDYAWKQHTEALITLAKLWVLETGVVEIYPDNLERVPYLTLETCSYLIDCCLLACDRAGVPRNHLLDLVTAKFADNQPDLPY